MSTAAALRWTVLVDGALPGPVNMARDAALANRVSEAVEGAGAAGSVGEEPPDADGGHTLPAFLRFYAWTRPTLSFGRNEPARDRFSAETLSAAGVDVVRRPTGGRAVLHDREVTYAVVVPDRALGGPRETYRRINGALADGLGRLGADVCLAPDAPATDLDAGPCFDLPAGGEVVARGRKLVGSAQARIGRALLQHGSILLEDDQGRVAELLRPDAAPPRGPPEARPVALTELLDRTPSVEAVVSAVRASLAEHLPGDWDGNRAGDGETRGGGHDAPRGADAHVGRYRDPDWTWRR